MRVYVVGPMTGLKELNRPAFEEARRDVEAEGDRCLIPHDFVPADATHERAMRMSLGYLVRHAERVVALPGWERSDGASLEVAAARACGIPVSFADGPADSWERLEEDAGKSPCAYFRRETPASIWSPASVCDGCEAEGTHECENVMARDLVRRARALAERGR